MRGKRLNLTVTEKLNRADRLDGTGTYSLIPVLNGGSDPESSYPYFGNKKDGSADCVGVGCWIQGIDRYQPGISTYGGWINTNSVFLIPQLFVNLGQDFTKVQLGDILAYKSYTGLLGKRHYGHWMTVVGFDKLYPTALSDIIVLHCSQRKPPATIRTKGFFKGKKNGWSFFRLK